MVDYFESLFFKQDADETKKLLWGSSTASALLGVQDFREIIGALVAHTAAWYNDGRGPSVVYNFLTGCRLKKGNINYAIIPLGTNLHDLELGTDTNAAHALALVAGYMLSKMNYV